MIVFNKVELPAGELTGKELGELKALLEGLAAHGQWKPVSDKAMGIKTQAGTSLFTTVSPGSSMVGTDPLSAMMRHTAFAAYAPTYVARLIEEVERLRKELGKA